MYTRIEDMADIGQVRLHLPYARGLGGPLSVLSSSLTHEYCPTPPPLHPRGAAFSILQERRFLQRTRHWRNANAKIAVCTNGAGARPTAPGGRYQ